MPKFFVGGNQKVDFSVTSGMTYAYVLTLMRKTWDNGRNEKTGCVSCPMYFWHRSFDPLVLGFMRAVRMG